MTRFAGGGPRADSTKLDYEQALNALLSLIGRQVLVLFSGTGAAPFISGVVSGRLDRGELDERLQTLILRGDLLPVETLFFHVGSRRSGFVVRPDEFVHAFWQDDGQLTLHLGGSAVTVIVQAELDDVLREEAGNSERRG